MTVDLRPCPFCGSSAEMSLNNFRYRHNTRCKSQIDALEKLEEYKKTGVLTNHVIAPQHTCKRAMWGVWVEFQRFTPRCSDRKCIGFSSKDFGSEAEAAAAWNRRVTNGL